jgi:FtsP/CotA-like multicopper oxidase with cupredoxin domain
MVLPDGMTSMSGMSGMGGTGGMAYNAWPVNGKLYPAIPTITVRKGEVVRVRFANVSNANHPMHLHGQDFRLVAIDGEPLVQPLVMNTYDLTLGQTVDLDFVADNEGTWLFHCHELHHAEQGLILTVEYEGAQQAALGQAAPQAPQPSQQPGQTIPSNMPGMNH